MTLVKFRGGPLADYVYDTKTLLGDEAINLPIIEYKWTSEKVRSEKTGAVAQIWIHHTLLNGQVEQPDLAVAAALAVSVPTPASPPPVPVPAAAVQSAAGVPVAQAGAVATLEAPAPVQEVTEAAPDVEAGHVGIPTGGINYENLLERRKGMKFSREQASAATGLAISKIIAIENNSGKRVKDDERRTLAEWVAAQEAGASARV